MILSQEMGPGRQGCMIFLRDCAGREIPTWRHISIPLRVGPHEFICDCMSVCVHGSMCICACLSECILYHPPSTVRADMFWRGFQNMTGLLTGS